MTSHSPSKSLVEPESDGAKPPINYPAAIASTKEAQPPTINHPPTLSALETEVIDLFVQISRLLGQARSLGETYGLLFISAAPLTMDDLIARLGLSKGSASQGLKFLRTNGAISAVYVPTFNLQLSTLNFHPLPARPDRAPPGQRPGPARPHRRDGPPAAGARTRPAEPPGDDAPELGKKEPQNFADHRENPGRLVCAPAVQ
ncbi:MAG TPA: hypothetical protein VNZ64_14500 [Candidatus Acidoferrum sp.]|jgi:hypothetical protein|nr:hypothetical protein [Candidatus Acidoferrum sp.]